MTAIEETAGGGFRIGAAVSGMALAEHPRFGKVWPGVLEAVNLIGSKQVQGRASAGGNLCNGSPAGDSVPAMVAAGAIVTVQGPNGRREMPVEKVPAGPGRTNLKPGEILVSFTLPPRPPGSGDAYLRMIPRTEMDIAVVGCGVSLTLKDGVCTAARVGLGAVAPTVLLVEAAAKALIGSRLDDAALDAAAAACSRRLPSDRRQARHHRLPHQNRRRAAEAHRRHRRKARRRELRTMAKLHVSTTINGEPMEFLCEPNDTMLDALRGPLALTGSKEGCASGDCGACSITLDDRLVCSCLMLAAEAEGHEIRTIEGMAHGEQAASAAAEIPGNGGAAVWHLHLGHAGRLRGAAQEESAPERGRGAVLACRQSLPVHRLRQDCPRGSGDRR